MVQSTLLRSGSGVSGRPNHRLLVGPKAGEAAGATGISMARRAFPSPPARSPSEAAVPTPSNAPGRKTPQGTHRGGAQEPAAAAAFLPGGAQLRSRAASPSPSGTALGAAGCQCRNMQPLIARDPWKIPGCVRPGMSRPATRSAWEVSRRPGKEGGVGAGAARRHESLGRSPLCTPPSSRPLVLYLLSTHQRGTHSQPRKGCQRRCCYDSLCLIPFSTERGAERGRGCPGQEKGSPEPRHCSELMDHVSSSLQPTPPYAHAPSFTLWRASGPIRLSLHLPVLKP